MIHDADFGILERNKVTFEESIFVRIAHLPIPFFVTLTTCLLNLSFAELNSIGYEFSIAGIRFQLEILLEGNNR